MNIKPITPMANVKYAHMLGENAPLKNSSAFAADGAETMKIIDATAAVKNESCPMRHARLSPDCTKHKNINKPKVPAATKIRDMVAPREKLDNISADTICHSDGFLPRVASLSKVN